MVRHEIKDIIDIIIRVVQIISATLPYLPKLLNWLKRQIFHRRKTKIMTINMIVITIHIQLEKPKQ